MNSSLTVSATAFEEVIEFDFENVEVVTEAVETDKLTIENPSDYYWTTTVTWVTKSGIQYLGYETTEDATADEILAIERYFDGLEDTYEESTASGEYTVYSKTELEFTLNYDVHLSYRPSIPSSRTKVQSS